MRKVWMFMIVLVLLALACTPSFAATSGQAALTWTPSPTAGATYTVYKSVAGGAMTVLQAGVVGLTFTDSGLPVNTNICYQVTATAPGSTESAPTTPFCGSAVQQTQTASPGSLSVVFSVVSTTAAPALKTAPIRK